MSEKTFKLFATILGIVTIVVVVYTILKSTGALDRISSVSELKDFILSGGIYSYLIFFLIQFLQVTFIPIPAFITTVAGTLVFGPWITTIISIVAQLLGAVVAFFIGRKLGRKVVTWIAGEEQTKKWEVQLGKGKYVFFLMMLFPVFPDDLLCLVAGLTSMTFKFFFVTNAITRPIGIVATCFFGSGYLIPFRGYWLILWAVIIIAMGAALVLSFIYHQQIENFVTNLGVKIKKKFEKQKVKK
jgi:uncharacterized membrane protein YdjX (TVP38/TMEM64 family)